MRRRTGLRNRFRDGKGTYSEQGKRRTADRYGGFEQGRQKSVEVINGRQVWHEWKAGKVT